MTIATLLDVVRGPEEVPTFGKSLSLEPAQPTTRPDRFPTQAVIVTAAARRIIELSKAGERLESIVVHGRIDPTLHPEFREISENLRELSAKWFPKAQLTLYSEQPSLENAQVRHALFAYDRPVLRLEAGTQKTFTALSGRPGAEFKALVEDMGKLELRNLVVRANFVRGGVDNSTESEVRAWLRYLGVIKPAVVQISTPEKAADGLKPITKTRFGQIAEMIGEKIGAQVEVI